VCNNEVKEYIRIVLSHLNCPESKKIVKRILCSEICEIKNKQHLCAQPGEKTVNILFIKLGDPKTLGHYFVWLKNIVDLH